MARNQPIAIVGIGSIFPGAADLESFWRNIESASCAASEIPAGRWPASPELFFDSHPGTPDRVYSTRGCFLPEFPFDPAGLDVDAALLAQLDPLFTLTLEAGRRAFLAAATANVDLRRTGVILANLMLPTEGSFKPTRETFLRELREKVLGKAANPTPAKFGKVEALETQAAALPAGLLARALRLGGGSFTLDAACASSLYAIKLACEELHSGRAAMMLAGGVSRPDSLFTQMGFSQLRALSPSGRSAPFDACADGLVVGEGAGIFALKRLDDALEAGDQIHGLIRGIGLSNDTGGSLLAPDSEGQLRAMRGAYAEANWTPHSVDLIECHATGTQVGDAVEAASLHALWNEAKANADPCVIGSVKSNIGHLLTAAGAAGLTKVLLAFKNQVLPPTANFERASAKLLLEDSPFRVLTASEPWERRTPSTLRRAAVSAFGFGGINAHMLVEEWDPELAEAPKKSSRRSRAAIKSPEPPPRLAIVGMEACFGDLGSLRAFQEAVLSGKPPRRTGRRGGLMQELTIPLNQFRISPQELNEMLPQQLLMLRTADRALNDASLQPADPSRTGVFIGIGQDLNATNFRQRWEIEADAQAWMKPLPASAAREQKEEWIERLKDASSVPLTAHRVTGSLGSMVASRIARELRAGGPSFVVAGEEASGLRALQIAAGALERGEIDLAIVGAVDLAGDPRAIRAAEIEERFSKTEHVHPFDQSASGTLPGEGAAALVIRRLGDALRDGNRIYATLGGIGAASGEKSAAFLQAIESVYAAAGGDPAHIGLIEANGSGIAEEDRIEAQTLAGFFGAAQTKHADSKAPPPIALGSAMPSIGHTGAAAGLASVVKAALCLYQEMLPALDSLAHPREELAGARGLLHTPRAPQYWLRNRSEGPRRAGVNCIARDGNFLHAVLEGIEADSGETDSRHRIERLQPLGPDSEALFAIEEDSPEELLMGLRRLADFVEEADPGAIMSIESLARSWHQRRRPGRIKAFAVAIVTRATAELVSQIEIARRAIREDPGRPFSKLPQAAGRIFYSPLPQAAEGELAFVFPGSGNQFPGMGTGIGSRWPEVMRRIDAENAEMLREFAAPKAGPWRLDWPAGWEGQAEEQLRRDHETMIFSHVSHGALLSDLVRSFAVEPSAVIGYSLGETAGYFAMRVWTSRDEMAERMSRSTLFKTDLVGPCKAARETWGLSPAEEVDWCVGIVDRPEEAVREALRGLSRSYLLIVNTPEECVIGGQRAEVMSIVERLGSKFFPIEGVSTVHCPIPLRVQKTYRGLHLFKTTPPPGVRFYSGAWGKAINITRPSAADSILAGALGTIDFAEMIRRAYADGVRVFAEMGPRNSCARMIGKILEGRPHAAFSACLPGQSAVGGVMRALAQLIVERVPVDLDRLYGDESIPAPTTDHSPGSTLIIPLGERGIEAPAMPDRVSVRSRSESASPLAHSSAALNLKTSQTLAETLLATQAKTAEAHDVFLRLSEASAQTQMQTLAFQMALLGGIQGSGISLPPAPAAPVAFSREACLEFARGSLARVLGPAFAEVDRHPLRVRLPDEPLMLVDRIVSVSGEPASMGSGALVTEHDVRPGAWYLDSGRMVPGVAIEAGQADLFLSAYLGIDLKTQGQSAYRLLDAAVEFHRGLPREGEVISYDIHIERFLRQGDTHMFFFHFEGSIDGDPLMSMSAGCAGFFTEKQLREGRGIVLTDEELKPRRGTLPDGFEPFARMKTESYDEAAVDALRAGDLERCFGEAFARVPVAKPLTLPKGRLALLHRVTEIDPHGGTHGIGVIRAEMDIHPDDWFLECHFVNDPVMPGTLMYESSLQALRIFMLRMGFVGEAATTAFEPVPGVRSRLKCRGQVIPETKRASYELSIKEIGFGPDPYAIADAIMYADGRAIVQVSDMSLKLTGASRESLDAIWSADAKRSSQSLVNSREQILEYAIGNPSEAFGESYRVFDGGKRFLARLPGPPYLFLDRITAAHAVPLKMEPNGVIEAQYDIPPDAWYFQANHQDTLPFSVLLEFPLQACGWFAAYMGSALTSDREMRFRNLGGSATMFEEVGRHSGTLTARVRALSISRSGGMIIQNYHFLATRDDRVVYEGETSFGFFSPAALAQQIGLRGVTPYSPSDAELAGARAIRWPEIPPATPDDARAPATSTPSLPGVAYRMIDTVDLYIADGGRHGLGFVRGSKAVDPSEWFFKAHFFMDPVVPGSLGLEAFLQLLKVVAIERWGSGEDSRFESIAKGVRHEWTYRGQVIPTNHRVTVEASITEISDADRLIRAEGTLSVDGLTIYGMKDFAIRMVGPA